MFHRVGERDFNLSHRRELFDNMILMPTRLPVLLSVFSLQRFFWGHSSCSVPSSDLTPDPRRGCGFLVCQGPHSRQPLGASRGVLCVLDCSALLFLVLQPLVAVLSPPYPGQPLTCHSRGLVGSGSWLLDGAEVRAEK